MTTWSLSTPTDATAGAETTFAEEGRLLRAIKDYLDPTDVERIAQTLAYMRELRDSKSVGKERLSSAQPPKVLQTSDVTPGRSNGTSQQIWDIEYASSVAQTLAEAVHVDAISIAAVLLYQVVESGIVSLEAVRIRLGDAFGEAVTQTIANIARFDTLQRPGAQLRRNALSGGNLGDSSRERRRSRERQRQQDAENIRKMFVAMTEDPRVAVFKIADQLHLMRAVSRVADLHREVAQEHTLLGAESTSDTSQATTPGNSDANSLQWTLEECLLLAQETREIYAPLAGRLGMSLVESELEDLAFAVLEPDDYRWLREAVAEYTQERESYVERVCALLREEMREIGLEANVSGRVKHLYSIYKKVRRSGSHDLSQLYDILAFRLIVDTVADCYLALGHVHALWRPKDGRIKDFIANPKPNGYQSLHTTVFCLDNRLAEIQIRTREMHQVAEYGVAMHWYYKDVGDAASAQAKALQSWVQQVREWQQELRISEGTPSNETMTVVKDDVLKEQIFVFTPAGDVKELPAGSTPLDFAYRVHSDVGNHVAGVRVASTDSNGRLVKKLVPLDYELKSGDVVEIIKRKDAHPTRDWLHIARTKVARDRILKYLKAHERDIDLQAGQERLDRELRSLGLRKGYDDLSEDDLDWLVEALDQSNIESLLVAVGSEKLRTSIVVAKLRERLRPPTTEPEPAEAPIITPPRETTLQASIGGISGMLTRLANCCNPLPGDTLVGFISRGRGVVIHRADCPNLAHLLVDQPERAVAVDWPKLDGQENFRAPIVIEATDRTGLLADVTGVITGMKINMLKVTTVTKPARHSATITATLEVQRPEQLTAVIQQIRQVGGVQSVERKKVNQEASSRRK